MKVGTYNYVKVRNHAKGNYMKFVITNYEYINIVITSFCKLMKAGSLAKFVRKSESSQKYESS